jgi:hypothetical protein
MDENSFECCVCLETMNNNHLMNIQCFHKICAECYARMLVNNLNTCPLCRLPFYNDYTSLSVIRYIYDSSNEDDDSDDDDVEYTNYENENDDYYENYD